MIIIIIIGKYNMQRGRTVINLWNYHVLEYRFLEIKMYKDNFS